MRVAIWIYGGIGGGNFSQGTPALNNFIIRIAQRHTLTVYSILPANPDFVAKDYRFQTINASIASLWIRVMLLILIFIWDHFRKSYAIIHGIWLYPAATIAVALGRILRIRSIASAHGGESAAIKSIEYGNMLGGRSKKWTLWTAHKAIALNFISQFQAEQMRKHGLTRKEFSVIPFGVDTHLFSPRTKESNGKIKILHVANLTEVKDQKTLIRAFKEIVKSQEAELRMVGPDHLNGELQRLAKELEIDQHISFLGAVAYNDISVHYYWADVMLHTSLYEGLPSSIIEAMASGIPVTSTSVGIVNDLGINFFEIVPFEDYEAIASQFILFWRDQNRRSEKCDNALQWANAHDIEWTTDQFDLLYQSLAK